jgi:hypothetical protein
VVRYVTTSGNLVLLALLATLSTASVLEPAAADEPQVLPEVRIKVDESAFNQLVLGGRNLAVIRQRLETLLTLKIDDVDRVCKLSDEQMSKLRLAGRGDIKRIDDLVERARRQLLGTDQEPSKLNIILAEVRPLHQAFESDPFDDRSIFMKTLKMSLTEPQLAEYQKTVREKVEFRFRSTVELVVAMWDRAAGLTNDQRKQVRELLLAETKPPRKPSEYDTVVVVCQAARLSESRLKTLFDDDQWPVVKKRLESATRMVPVLAQGGLLPEGDIDANRREPAPPP